MPADAPVREGREDDLRGLWRWRIGTPSGITKDTCEVPLSPRACRKSCISSAVSLGAGGHLNGVDVTPTTTRPPANRSSTPRSANAPATV
jgi:hypothetical protein